MVAAEFHICWGTQAWLGRWLKWRDSYTVVRVAAYVQWLRLTVLLYSNTKRSKMYGKPTESFPGILSAEQCARNAWGPCEHCVVQVFPHLASRCSGSCSSVVCRFCTHRFDNFNCIFWYFNVHPQDSQQQGSERILDTHRESKTLPWQFGEKFATQGGILSNTLNSSLLICCKVLWLVPSHTANGQRKRWTWIISLPPFSWEGVGSSLPSIQLGSLQIFWRKISSFCFSWEGSTSSITQWSREETGNFQGWFCYDHFTIHWLEFLILIRSKIGIRSTSQTWRNWVSLQSWAKHNWLNCWATNIPIISGRRHISWEEDSLNRNDLNEQSFSYSRWPFKSCLTIV